MGTDDTTPDGKIIQTFAGTPLHTIADGTEKQVEDTGTLEQVDKMIDDLNRANNPPPPAPSQPTPPPSIVPPSNTGTNIEEGDLNNDSGGDLETRTDSHGPYDITG